MAPVLFEIGPFTLHSLWVANTIALILGTLLFLKRAKYERLDVLFLLDHGMSLLLSAIAFSRLAFFVSNWGYLSDLDWTLALKQVVRFWQPGYSFWGAFLGFGLMFVLHAYRHKIKILPWLDAALTPILIGLFIGNIGQLLDGQGYGRETILPWGITFQNTNVKYTVPVHPTQIYSMLLVVGILIAKKKVLDQWPHLKNNHLWMMLAIDVYALGRFIIGFYRGDDTLLLWNIRIEQWISVAVFIPLSYLLYKKLVLNR